MFSEIELDEPLEKIVDDWDFLADRILPRYSAFRDVGDSVIGLRRRVIAASGMQDAKKGAIGQLVELGPGGVGEGSVAPFRLRITAAGTPHRVPHNFGYWHVNDKDELYIPVPGLAENEPGFFIVLMGQPKGNDTDAFAWYCEKCFTLLYDHVSHTGGTGIAGFWKAEREAVKAYNGNARLRTCDECGHLNPLGYCWNSAKDTPQEALARTHW